MKSNQFHFYKFVSYYTFLQIIFVIQLSCLAKTCPDQISALKVQDPSSTFDKSDRAARVNEAQSLNARLATLNHLAGSARSLRITPENIQFIEQMKAALTQTGWRGRYQIEKDRIINEAVSGAERRRIQRWVDQIEEALKNLELQVWQLYFHDKPTVIASNYRYSLSDSFELMESVVPIAKDRETYERFALGYQGKSSSGNVVIQYRPTINDRDQEFRRRNIKGLPISRSLIFRGDSGSTVYSYRSSLGDAPAEYARYKFSDGVTQNGAIQKTADSYALSLDLQFIQWRDMKYNLAYLALQQLQAQLVRPRITRIEVSANYQILIAQPKEE